MIIHEGRKRQVRRMLEAVGHRVVALHRARFATSDATRGLDARTGARRLRPRQEIAGASEVGRCWRSLLYTGLSRIYVG